MTASCSSVFRLQTLRAPGVLLKIFPQDKWKSAISFKHPINMSYKTRHNWAPKAQFYYSFLSLSGIASSLRFQVIIALCTLEWHKLALWGKNQLAGCPSLPVWPGHDKHTSTNACKRHPKCASTFKWRMCLGSAWLWFKTESKTSFSTVTGQSLLKTRTALYHYLIWFYTIKLGKIVLS